MMTNLLFLLLCLLPVLAIIYWQALHQVLKDWQDSGEPPALLDTALVFRGPPDALLEFLNAPVTLEKQLTGGRVVNLDSIVLWLEVPPADGKKEDVKKIQHWALGGAALAVLAGVIFKDIFNKPDGPKRYA
jgi:hypothetical protein